MHLLIRIRIYDHFFLMYNKINKMLRLEWKYIVPSTMLQLPS